MSVKRYELTDNGVEVFSDGRYVLHSDYADLLARHNALVIEHAALLINNNALVEAVAWERECDSVWYSATLNLTNPALYELFSTYDAARAEVDRLLAEGEK